MADNQHIEDANFLRSFSEGSSVNIQEVRRLHAIADRVYPLAKHDTADTAVTGKTTLLEAELRQAQEALKQRDLDVAKAREEKAEVERMAIKERSTFNAERESRANTEGGRGGSAFAPQVRDVTTEPPAGHRVAGAPVGVDVKVSRPAAGTISDKPQGHPAISADDLRTDKPSGVAGSDVKRK